MRGPTAIDHCEPEKRAKEHGIIDFAAHPARKWLSELIGPGPKQLLIDITRSFHPDRTRMFTCWETKTSARSASHRVC